VLDEIPGQSSFLALAWLADGEGEMSVVLSIERLDTLEEIYRDEKRLKFTDRLQDTRFLARIRTCDIPVVGLCQVSLTMDGELIAHASFAFARKVPNMAQCQEDSGYFTTENCVDFWLDGPGDRTVRPLTGARLEQAKALRALIMEEEAKQKEQQNSKSA
jgi:enoyl-CoA hydratase/carnithine racemase